MPMERKVRTGTDADARRLKARSEDVAEIVSAFLYRGGT